MQATDVAQGRSCDLGFGYYAGWWEARGPRARILAEWALSVRVARVEAWRPVGHGPAWWRLRVTRRAGAENQAQVRPVFGAGGDRNGSHVRAGQTLQASALVHEAWLRFADNAD